MQLFFIFLAVLTLPAVGIEHSDISSNTPLGEASECSKNFFRIMEAYKRSEYTEVVKRLESLLLTGPTSNIHPATSSAAQYKLGYMNEQGQGVPKSNKKAVYWYTLAAKQKHITSQEKLGIMYASGIGVTLDYTKAIKWLTLAAEQNSPHAQYNLGLIYYENKAGVQNYALAFRYFLSAAYNKHTKAERLVKLMYRDGTATFQNDNEAIQRLY